jgi:hypothetical protein
MLPTRCFFAPIKCASMMARRTERTHSISSTILGPGVIKAFVSVASWARAAAIASRQRCTSFGSLFCVSVARSHRQPWAAASITVVAYCRLFAPSSPNCLRMSWISALSSSERGDCGGAGAPTSYPCNQRPRLMQAAKLYFAKTSLTRHSFR